MNEAFATPTVAIEIRSGGRNEDRARYFSTPERSVFVLADGAGGVGGGAIAAEIVVQEAQSLFQHRHKSAYDALVAAEQKLALLGCMSTGVIVELSNGQLNGASCGDSVAWLICQDRVLELSSGQFRKPLLGDGGMPVSFGPILFVGRLMLSSDGLVNYVLSDAIIRAATQYDIADAAKALVELPRLKSGAFPDDVAILLAESTSEVVPRSPLDTK